MISSLIGKIKGKGIRIVFTEGSDPRVLKAAVRLHEEGILNPVLLGNRAEIYGCAKASGLSVDGIETLDPHEYKSMNEMVIKMVELRKGKMDAETCHKLLLQTNYFGTMLVQMGFADGLLGGATYSTADTVRPGFQLFYFVKG